MVCQNPKGQLWVELWKDISKETRQLKQNCCFILGDGNIIRFWEDSWCGEGTLCVAFPALFAIADSKGALVADVWDTLRAEGAWNLSFVRSFNDWELDIVQHFICLINNMKVDLLGRDRLFWKGDKNGMYTVKENYKRIEGGDVKVVPINLLWNSCVPPKVRFFAWEA